MHKNCALLLNNPKYVQTWTNVQINGPHGSGLLRYFRGKSRRHAGSVPPDLSSFRCSASLKSCQPGQICKNLPPFSDLREILFMSRMFHLFRDPGYIQSHDLSGDTVKVALHPFSADGIVNMVDQTLILQSEPGSGDKAVLPGVHIQML